METATVADRIGRYDSSATPHSDSDSPAPEVGSVKDKIGIFGTKSFASRPKDEFDKTPRDILPVTSRPTDQLSPRPTIKKFSSPSHERISKVADIGTKEAENVAQSQPDHAEGPLDPSASRPTNKTPTDNPVETPSQNDKQPPPTKTKPPPIPRKPVKLAHTKPPDPNVSPSTEHSVDLTDPHSNTSPKSELPAVIGRSRSPRPYNYNGKQSPSQYLKDDSNQSTPSPEEFKPKLPPRTGTFSREQSSSPHPSLSSSDDRRPALPPRRKAQFILRKLEGSQGINLVDNESPSSSTPDVASSSRSLNDSYPRLTDEPIIMDERRPSGAGGYSPISPGQVSSAKKVPPPPPRQRRTGIQSVPLEEMGRGFTGTPSMNSSQTSLSSFSSDMLSEKYRQTPPIRSIPRKVPGSDQSNSKPMITEKEQKRYERVWTANKGLFIPGPKEPFFEMYPPRASEMVLNLVTRDIWSRSRLPNEVLGQVWDLVDRQNIRLLTREEFIVGMWLIDQILKGNRLPSKVPDSVWASLKHPPKPGVRLIRT